MNDLVAECRARSLRLLEECSDPAGFVASPAFDHYAGIWTRDAAVASLGALAVGSPALVTTVAATLRTLAARIGPGGQIPNTVWPARRRWDWGEGGAVDASAWFVVVLDHHHRVTKDDALLEEMMPVATRAVRWLAGLDTTGTGVIDSPPAGDWMDAALVRYGRVFHVNLLYWWAAAGHRRLATITGSPPLGDPDELRRRIEVVFWPDGAESYDTLFGHVEGRDGVPFGHAATAEGRRRAAIDRRHYVSHVVHGGYVDRCDVLANVLAVLSGLAGRERSLRILDHLDAVAVASPYPSRAWPVPIPDGDRWGMRLTALDDVIPERWRTPPHRYHNAAAWPFIGAFHAAAEARAGRPGTARERLERVADANALADWSFPEWIHGRTGEPGGATRQVWNAGAFLLADALISSAGSG